MLKRFIERPVLSTVISVLIVLLGLLGLMKYPLHNILIYRRLQCRSLPTMPEQMPMWY